MPIVIMSIAFAGEIKALDDSARDAGMTRRNAGIQHRNANATTVKTAVAGLREHRCLAESWSRCDQDLSAAGRVTRTLPTH